MRLDFQTFAHVHVEDTSPVTAQMLKDAVFPVQYTFPRAGKYLIGVDFTAEAQAASHLQVTVERFLALRIAIPGDVRELGHPPPPNFRQQFAYHPVGIGV